MNSKSKAEQVIQSLVETSTNEHVAELRRDTQHAYESLNAFVRELADEPDDEATQNLRKSAGVIRDSLVKIRKELDVLESAIDGPADDSPSHTVKRMQDEDDED